MTALSFLCSYPQLVGIPLVLLYGLWRYSSRPGADKRTDWLVAAAAIAVPAELAAQAITVWLSDLRPAKYDLYIYWLDGRLGFQPSFAIGQLTAHHLWLHQLLAFTYGSCTLGMLAVFIAYLWLRSETETVDLVRAFGLNLFAAVPIYLLVPVCGPAFAFADFPALPAQLSPHLIAISAPPNGIPSVHFSTALLVAWFARHWPVGRVAGAIYVVLTAAATMGSGQHYLFDLLIAVPYAMCICRLALRRANNECAAETVGSKPKPAAQDEEPAGVCVGEARGLTSPTEL
jgi:PAP2 superfamily protein